MEILENKEVLKKVKCDHTCSSSVLKQTTSTMTVEGMLNAKVEITSYAEVITSLEEAINIKTSELSFTETPKGGLCKFKGNAFLCLQMSTLVLCGRIVQNLIAHKFKMEKLERLVCYGDWIGKYF